VLSASFSFQPGCGHWTISIACATQAIEASGLSARGVDFRPKQISGSIRGCIRPSRRTVAALPRQGTSVRSYTVPQIGS
jgi:hypothetical protein